VPAPSPPAPLPQAGEGRKRRRKGNVHRSPYRARLEELLRADTYTLDEMVAIIKAEYPDEPVSRSSVHRYDAQIRSFTEKMQELETHAKIIADKYGKSEETGNLLANAVMALTTDTALNLMASGAAELDDVRKLSQTAKNAIQGKQVSLHVRKQIEAETRAKVLAEQKAKLEALEKTGAIDKAALATIIKAAYAL